MMPPPQVDASLYRSKRYLTRERWAGYWHQMDAVRTWTAKTVLEIGVGNGMVTDALRRLGYDVKTIDIDPALHPDVIANVTPLPFPDHSFDVVLCAEVLEHLPWDESFQAMKEIVRVARVGAVITLPHAGYVWSVGWKVPLVSLKFWVWKLPHFWKTHQWNGEHHWELGKKGFSRARIADALRDDRCTGVSVRIHEDDPGHVVCTCQTGKQTDRERT